MNVKVGDKICFDLDYMKSKYIKYGIITFIFESSEMSTIIADEYTDWTFSKETGFVCTFNKKQINYKY